MVKPISLSVHKNNREQKRRKYGREAMKHAAKYLRKTDCTEGFFFVSWDKDGAFQTRFHDPARIIGMSALPNFVGGTAARLIGDIDAEDREK